MSRALLLVGAALAVRSARGELNFSSEIGSLRGTGRDVARGATDKQLALQNWLRGLADEASSSGGVWPAPYTSNATGNLERQNDMTSYRCEQPDHACVRVNTSDCLCLPFCRQPRILRVCRRRAHDGAHAGAWSSTLPSQAPRRFARHSFDRSFYVFNMTPPLPLPPRAACGRCSGVPRGRDAHARTARRAHDGRARLALLGAGGRLRAVLPHSVRLCHSSRLAASRLRL